MIQAITLKELSDEDWKTQLAKGYPNIPANTIVKVLNDNFVNFYGSFCEVEWQGRHYYVNKNGLGAIKMEPISGKSEEI